MSIAKAEDMPDSVRRWWTRAVNRAELAVHVEAKAAGLTPEDLKAQAEAEFPVNRDECRGGERPCPFARCKHNLAVSITPTGAIRELEGWMDGGPTCELDLIESRGRMKQEEVAAVLGMSRAAVELEEANALRKIHPLIRKLGYAIAPEGFLKLAATCMSDGRIPTLKEIEKAPTEEIGAFLKKERKKGFRQRRRSKRDRQGWGVGR